LRRAAVPRRFPYTTLFRSSADADAAAAVQETAGVLSAVARGWPGAALVIGPDGRVVAASPLSGLTEDMRAPFELPVAPIASQLVDRKSTRLNSSHVKTSYA